jgi:2-succinyl-5-enolpyruvyl-6-hydroxy-3-cyclohexene-1-carboxylate synthase
VAETFDLSYHQPTSGEAFRAAYRRACTGDDSAFIEVRTDRDANRRVHEELERAVAAAVADEGG